MRRSVTILLFLLANMFAFKAMCTPSKGTSGVGNLVLGDGYASLYLYVKSFSNDTQAAYYHLRLRGEVQDSSADIYLSFNVRGNETYVGNIKVDMQLADSMLTIDSNINVVAPASFKKNLTSLLLGVYFIVHALNGTTEIKEIEVKGDKFRVSLTITFLNENITKLFRIFFNEIRDTKLWGEVTVNVTAHGTSEINLKGIVRGPFTAKGMVNYILKLMKDKDLDSYGLKVGREVKVSVKSRGGVTVMNVQGLRGSCYNVQNLIHDLIGESCKLQC